MNKLLIVENDSGVREGLVLGLSDFFSVSEASGTGEALRALELDSPDVVLLDQHIDQASGTALLEKLSRLPVRPGVVLYSASMNVNLARQALQLGVEDCASKPFSLEDLKAKLDRAAQRRTFCLAGLPFAGKVASLLRFCVDEGHSHGSSLETAKQDFVQALFQEALFDTQGDIERAAERLCLSPEEFKSWSDLYFRSK